MKAPYLLGILLSLSLGLYHCSVQSKDIKILVLIIASEDKPVYVELQKIWRSYMHLDPEHVEAYFIKGDPNLTKEYEIIGDVVRSRTAEGLMPGIINKTILSMEAFLPRIKTEFDYVLRTNLSSFYMFDRLLEYLKTEPKNNYYGGYIHERLGRFVNGGGILLSSDVAELMVKSKQFFWNNKSHYDDVIIGQLLRHYGITPVADRRIACYFLEDWKGADQIPDDIFHMRIKLPEHLRLQHDIEIQSQLLNKFYGISRNRNVSDYNELKTVYEQNCTRTSDINEHLPVLYSLSQQCSSVMEIGIRSMVSSWAVFLGLAENSSAFPRYIGVDLNYPPANTLNLAQRLTESNGISFEFWQANDMSLAIEDVDPIDLLFIDSLHTYCHLTYELEKFSPKAQKYIALHDTSAPWGNRDDTAYTGNYSEYPAEYDRTKKGLWPAVEDFLARHPEWSLFERRFNNHGFTVLKRVTD